MSDDNDEVYAARLAKAEAEVAELRASIAVLAAEGNLAAAQISEHFYRRQLLLLRTLIEVALEALGQSHDPITRAASRTLANGLAANNDAVLAHEKVLGT